MSKSWIVYASMWASTAVTIMFTVYMTGRITPLWWLLVPLFVNVAVDNKGGKKDDK